MIHEIYEHLTSSNVVRACEGVTTTRHSPVHELREELVGEGDGELCEDGFELFETNEAVEVPVHGHEHALDVRVVLAHLNSNVFKQLIQA